MRGKAIQLKPQIFSSLTFFAEMAKEYTQDLTTVERTFQPPPLELIFRGITMHLITVNS
jgi:hypothetical protein